jgi:hypothetical protein
MLTFILVLSLSVPYQNNCWDCGVFVCRYAYSVYALRDRDFRRDEQWFAKDLTRIEQFQGLSGIFLPWKIEQQHSLTKQANRDATKSRPRAIAANDANSPAPSEMPDYVDAPTGDTAGAVDGCKCSNQNDNPCPSLHLARLGDKEDDTLASFRSPSRLHSNGGASKPAVSTPLSGGSLTYLTGESQTDTI